MIFACNRSFPSKARILPLMRMHTAITNARMLPFCADTKIAHARMLPLCAGSQLFTSLRFGSKEPNNQLSVNVQASSLIDLQKSLHLIFISHFQGRIQNLHCRGGGYKWPMKPKASLRREAPKGGGWGRGSPPPAGGGPGGLPRKFFFWEIASKWCILSAFWGN